MAKQPDKHDLNGLLRAAFERSGMSIKAMADAGGVPYAVAHGFVTRGQDIRLSTAGKLCGVLGLTLSATKRRAR